MKKIYEKYVINKKIADYMGEECIEGLGIRGGRVGTSVDPSAHYVRDFYTESVNECLPVVQKLGNFWLQIQQNNEDYCAELNEETGWGNTPSMALANAIVSAIERMIDNPNLSIKGS